MTGCRGLMAAVCRLIGNALLILRNQDSALIAGTDIETTKIIALREKNEKYRHQDRFII
jgi:hypothetical protein